ncbi:MAG: hypothetical protein ACUVRZ_12220, partial [Desulfobacca sp.]|uniref:hypothetical protein n=1 Tax=Desulfobacca sp. TaxID=2067990 RepID=UPI00404AFD9E
EHEGDKIHDNCGYNPIFCAFQVDFLIGWAFPIAPEQGRYYNEHIPLDFLAGAWSAQSPMGG